MSRDTLKSLIQALLDGSIDASDLTTLEATLERSEEARKLYIEYAEIHSLLEQSTYLVRAATNVVPIERIISRQRRRSMRIAAIAAAAVILISLVSLRLFMIDEQPPTLSFKTTLETEFTLTHSKDKSETSGMTMEKGSRLQVSKGIVELTFASGVRSVIRAPADVTLHEDDKLFMKQGTAWFEVPKKAVGFTVKTEDLNIVDLGTEFGVIAKPGNYDEVHVFKGKVKVDALGIRKESTTLVANEARRNDHIGRLATIKTNQYLFLKKLPDSSGLPPYLHWSFDEKDQFNVQGTHPEVQKITSKPSPSHAPPELVEGKYGSALSLNGKQQSLVTNWQGIFGADRPLSTAVWVRIPEGVNLTELPAIVGWGIPSGSRAKWKVQVAQSSITEPPVARVSIGVHFANGTTRLDDNQWHHITAVYNGRESETGEPEFTLYIDGKEEKLTHHKSPMTSSSWDEHEEAQRSPDAKPMVIGKGPVSQKVTFRGLIDELYIFDGSISRETVKTLIYSEPKNKKQNR